jgi:hypothetical protein
MANKIGKFVASIVELFSRKVVPTGEDRIYSQDSDNLYPNRVELVQKNSVTASAASKKMRAFIVGRGFVNKEFNELVVNTKTGMKGYQFLNKVAKSLSTHRGVFVHVNYDIFGSVNYLEVLPYKKMRKSKEDSNGFPGCYYMKDWEDEGKGFSKSDTSCRWFYPFNRNDEVILQQRAADVADKKRETSDESNLVTDYRGQVFYLNLDDDQVYSDAWIDPVYNDCDSEYRFSLYTNSNVRNGFLEKTILVANGLDEESAEELAKDVKGWLGAENTASVYLFTPQGEIEDPEKLFTTVSLKGNFDTKRFDTDKESISNNIRKAFLCIPKILIDQTESVFANSGEALKQAVSYYNEETLHLREAVAYMMDNFFDGDFSITQLGVSDIINNTGTNEK